MAIGLTFLPVAHITWVKTEQAHSGRKMLTVCRKVKHKVTSETDCQYDNKDRPLQVRFNAQVNAQKRKIRLQNVLFNKLLII
jgi:hypothetical protein